MLVFPFRTSGPDAQSYGEGLADLLIVTLDGTPGIRVPDPTSLWRELRPEKGAPARAPEADEALTLSGRAGARRYVTGAVVAAGSRLDVSARVYDAAGGEALASLSATAHEDSVAQAVQRLAIDLVASVWEREQLPTVSTIERFATDNVDALKAYLEAKSLARRGRFAEAQPAIERAVALDSAFALAHLEHFNIRSWILFMNAEPFLGLREIIDAAMRHRGKLTPRNRMRIEANRALDETDGIRAAFLLERVLSLDSLDVDAQHALAFTYLRDGWQLGKQIDEIVAAYDRVLRVDPTSITARGTLARLAMLSDDSAEVRQAIQQLRSADTTSAYVLGTLGALQALTAPEAEVDSSLRSLAGQPIPVVTTVLRELRTHRPALAERYFHELMADSRPVMHQRIGLGARTQLWMAEGRLEAVDSVLQTGQLDNIRAFINLYYVTAALAGVGKERLTAQAADWLSAYVPADSLLHYWEQRPVWPIGWAMGAYHATFGDTVQARTWAAALGTLPGGGTALDYRTSLQADIEARIAARRGDLEAAAREGRRAYDNWGIHSGYFQDYHPEVAMRFHLAETLGAQGATEQAAALYRSFLPPHTWYAFYTARASFELGRIEEARGNRAEARHHYLRAVRLWERGEPEVVSPWLAQARDGLSRLRGERATS